MFHFGKTKFQFFSSNTKYNSINNARFLYKDILLKPLLVLCSDDDEKTEAIKKYQRRIILPFKKSKLFKTKRIKLLNNFDFLKGRKQLTILKNTSHFVLLKTRFLNFKLLKKSLLTLRFKYFLLELFKYIKIKSESKIYSFLKKKILKNKNFLVFDKNFFLKKLSLLSFNTYFRIGFIFFLIFLRLFLFYVLIYFIKLKIYKKLKITHFHFFSNIEIQLLLQKNISLRNKFKAKLLNFFFEKNNFDLQLLLSGINGEFINLIFPMNLRFNFLNIDLHNLKKYNIKTNLFNLKIFLTWHDLFFKKAFTVKKLTITIKYLINFLQFIKNRNLKRRLYKSTFNNYKFYLLTKDFFYQKLRNRAKFPFILLRRLLKFKEKNLDKIKFREYLVNKKKKNKFNQDFDITNKNNLTKLIKLEIDIERLKRGLKLKLQNIKNFKSKIKIYFNKLRLLENLQKKIHYRYVTQLIKIVNKTFPMINLKKNQFNLLHSIQKLKTNLIKKNLINTLKGKILLIFCDLKLMQYLFLVKFINEKKIKLNKSKFLFLKKEQIYNDLIVKLSMKEKKYKRLLTRRNEIFPGNRYLFNRFSKNFKFFPRFMSTNRLTYKTSYPIFASNDFFSKKNYFDKFFFTRLNTEFMRLKKILKLKKKLFINEKKKRKLKRIVKKWILLKKKIKKKKIKKKQVKKNQLITLRQSIINDRIFNDYRANREINFKSKKFNQIGKLTKNIQFFQDAIFLNLSKLLLIKTNSVIKLKNFFYKLPKDMIIVKKTKNNIYMHFLQNSQLKVKQSLGYFKTVNFIQSRRRINFSIARSFGQFFARRVINYLNFTRLLNNQNILKQQFFNLKKNYNFFILYKLNKKILMIVNSYLKNENKSLFLKKKLLKLQLLFMIRVFKFIQLKLQNYFKTYSRNVFINKNVLTDNKISLIFTGFFNNAIRFAILKGLQEYIFLPYERTFFIIPAGHNGLRAKKLSHKKR